MFREGKDELCAQGYDIFIYVIVSSLRCDELHIYKVFAKYGTLAKRVDSICKCITHAINISVRV